MYFIVIEGCDHFGKSTQVKLLAEKLVHCGLKTQVFSFPNYESSTGKIIADHLHDKISLMVREPSKLLSILPKPHVSPHDSLVFQCVQTCDKYAVAAKILAAQRDGEIVVCGRWWQSAYVYGLDDGLDPMWLMDVHTCLPKADLNLLLDFSPNEAAGRFVDSPDRYERDLPKQRRLRDSYLKLWSSMSGLYGSGGWKVLSAEGSIEEIHERIVTCVKNYLSYFTKLNPRAWEL